MNAIWILLAILVGQTCGQDDEFVDRARELLQTTPLIDGHNDLPWNVILNFDGQLSGFNLEEDMCEQVTNGICHTDIPKLTEGQVGAQFWSIFTRCNTQYQDGVDRAMEEIDITKRIINKYSDVLELVTDADGIENAKANGKIGSLLGLEGGHMMAFSMGILRMLYELGIRYLTLTWNCNTPWADYSNPTGDELTPPNDGLTDWGKDLILEMNRMGMFVDLSHVSHAVMHDALDVSLAPVIFSHSSAFELCPHQRNVPNDVLRRLERNGGVVMVNFYNKFLNCTEDNISEPGFRRATLDLLLDHIEHIRDEASVDNIGLGSDYDGVSYVPEGVEDTSKFPYVIAGLLRRGWSEEDAMKVAGNNLLRAMREMEAVRDALASFEPNEEPIDYNRVPEMSCKNLPDWRGNNYKHHKYSRNNDYKVGSCEE